MTKEEAIDIITHKIDLELLPDSAKTRLAKELTNWTGRSAVVVLTLAEFYPRKIEKIETKKRIARVYSFFKKGC